MGAITLQKVEEKIPRLSLIKIWQFLLIVFISFLLGPGSVIFVYKPTERWIVWLFAICNCIIVAQFFWISSVRLGNLQFYYFFQITLWVTVHIPLPSWDFMFVYEARKIVPFPFLWLTVILFTWAMICMCTVALFLLTRFWSAKILF